MFMKIKTSTKPYRKRSKKVQKSTSNYKKSTREYREQNCSSECIVGRAQEYKGEHKSLFIPPKYWITLLLQNKELRGSSYFLKTINEIIQKYGNMVESIILFFWVRKVEVKSYTPTLLLLSILNFCQCFVISLSTFDEFLSNLGNTMIHFPNNFSKYLIFSKKKLVSRFFFQCSIHTFKFFLSYF